MLKKLITAALVVLVTSVVVNAEETSTNDMMAGMSYPMQKSMDPQVWTQMMGMMMDPAKMMSMESCALCHDGEDLARYSKDFGPMLEASQQMGQLMSPHQMMQSMNPMMSSMMNPMAMMMNPMTMMYPMMGMMGPMMGMMNPMMMGMMNPMTMMNPMMMGGSMMNPMMMGGNMMNPMGMGGSYNANPMGQMMKPEQYTDWFNQMMKQFTPAQPAAK